jgi:glutathione synthase/RimK-type ligase-like ATP-grasp enzyme
MTPVQRETAERTARLMGLEVAAVDLLDLRGGPKVFEVNSSPALPEMERVCQVDLAARIIERAEAILRERAKSKPARPRRQIALKENGRAARQAGRP